MASSPSTGAFLVLLLLAGLLPHLSMLVSAANAFTLVPPNGVRFSPRQNAANFAWGGAIWTAGGVDSQGNALSDVWGSYDFGRTWIQPVDSNGVVVDLPGSCASSGSQAVIYAGAVYLVCSYNIHAYYGPTYTSTSLTLSSPWTQLDDSCGDCRSFPVNRMAVPFDGVGTLITFNVFASYGSVDLRNVLWQSATGNFQPTMDVDGPIPGTGTKDTWVAFQAGGGVVGVATRNSGGPFLTPWPQRSDSSATVDAEGLQCIMTGGIGQFGGTMNDVWQLSWQSSFVNPLVAQLTDAAQFSPRFAATLYTVHDYFFLAGGRPSTNAVDEFTFLDDAWMSPDLGRTWTQYSTAVTGSGAAYFDHVRLGRRFFVVAPLTASQGQYITTNDVYEADW